MKIKYLISLVILSSFMQCKKQDDLYAVNNPDGIPINNIIRISNLSNTSVAADSASSINITIQITPEADDNLDTITFKTSGGVFANGDTIQTIKANSSGIADASLVCSKPEQVRISAKVLSYSVDTVVSFTASLPQDMLLSSNAYTGDTTSSFTITDFLFRNNNKELVSDPVKVFFNVVPAIGSLNLVYPEFAFSQNRAASITITNPYAVTGDFKIEAKALSPTNDTLYKSLIIKIR